MCLFPLRAWSGPQVTVGLSIVVGVLAIKLQYASQKIGPYQEPADYPFYGTWLHAPLQIWAFKFYCLSTVQYAEYNIT